MARRMMGKRPGLMVAIGIKPKGADEEQGEDMPDRETGPGESHDMPMGKHEVLCKVCDTVIDAETGEPVEDAKNKQDAEDSKDMGAPIDKGESSYPTPGKFGAAADAARGEDAISRALEMLGGKR
jgi:hypothetical protein